MSESISNYEAFVRLAPWLSFKLVIDERTKQAGILSTVRGYSSPPVRWFSKDDLNAEDGPLLRELRRLAGFVAAERHL